MKEPLSTLKELTVYREGRRARLSSQAVLSALQGETCWGTQHSTASGQQERLQEALQTVPRSSQLTNPPAVPGMQDLDAETGRVGCPIPKQGQMSPAEHPRHAAPSLAPAVAQGDEESRLQSCSCALLLPFHYHKSNCSLQKAASPWRILNQIVSISSQ